jgi:hypothetical protein
MVANVYHTKTMFPVVDNVLNTHVSHSYTNP